MNSYLITGGAKQERLKKAKELIKNCQLETKNWTQHPDFLIIKPSPSIGIQAIRRLQKFLSRKPYQNKFKIVLVPEADKITIPAQNAFLKTLEEPPLNSKIFLICSNQDQLLNTIVSRCQLIKLPVKLKKTMKKKALNKSLLLINKILKSGVGERLKLIEPYEKNREEAIKFCQEMIVSLRKDMLSNHQSSTINHQSSIIHALQKALSLLKANVNVKLVLDNLVISL